MARIPRIPRSAVGADVLRRLLANATARRGGERGSRINAGLTHAEALEVLSQAVPESRTDVDWLTATNILRECLGVSRQRAKRIALSGEVAPEMLDLLRDVPLPEDLDVQVEGEVVDE